MKADPATLYIYPEAAYIGNCCAGGEGPPAATGCGIILERFLLERYPRSGILGGGNPRAAARPDMQRTIRQARHSQRRIASGSEFVFFLRLLYCLSTTLGKILAKPLIEEFRYCGANRERVRSVTHCGSRAVRICSIANSARW